MVTGMKGRVYFVGAGPGDPELLTVKALELMKRADVVIYDSLVTKEIVQFIPESVRKIGIRKSPRAKGLSLQEMCSLMIAYTNSGETVVRLKSGDPLIFGRTWEEIEYLKNAGIEYEIVPGITSALSSAALAGVPLTDRRFSSSFAVVTGHEAKGKSTGSIDWNTLAKSVDTLVVLMGVSTVKEYSRKLLDAGVEPSAVVTVVSNASRIDQKIFRTTLEEVKEGIPEEYGDLCTVIISMKNLATPLIEEPVRTYLGACH